MTGAPIATDTRRLRIIRDLHELIAALDRRVPQIERMGEVAIARAAARIRAEALQRIEELEGGTSLESPSVRAHAPPAHR